MHNGTSTKRLYMFTAVPQQNADHTHLHGFVSCSWNLTEKTRSCWGKFRPCWRIKVPKSTKYWLWSWLALGKLCFIYCIFAHWTHFPSKIQRYRGGLRFLRITVHLSWPWASSYARNISTKKTSKSQIKSTSTKHHRTGFFHLKTSQTLPPSTVIYSVGLHFAEQQARPHFLYKHTDTVSKQQVPDATLEKFFWGNISGPLAVRQCRVYHVSAHCPVPCYTPDS